MSTAVETAPKVQRSIRDKVGKVRDDVLGLERQLGEVKGRFEATDDPDAKKRFKESVEGHVYEIWSKLSQGYKSALSLGEVREFYGLAPYKN